jgi:Carboxypeptidase regulatory-like domain
MRNRIPGVRWGVVVILGSVAMLVGSPAAAQGTATIIGQVTDGSGGVLPGVTVTATSPALQVAQLTTITNDVGEYRLAPLPIGVFQLTFDLAGFGPVQRENIRLTVGFTARIDVSLALGAVAETVTVSGAAPVVDVAATSPSTLFTTEMLAAIPTSRNGLISLLNLAPGVRSFLDIGGNTIEENPAARTFGQAGQVWFTIEGVSTTHLSDTGGDGSYWDYTTLDETRVQTVGTDAEFQTRGAQTAGVVKSGGNQFHGGVSWDQNNHNFQSDNLDDDLRAQGFTVGNALKTHYDISGDLGGRIIENTLWFYVAGRRRYQEKEVLNAFLPDGSPAYDQTRLDFRTVKLSYQATPGNRFIGFTQWAKKFERSKTSELRAFDARSDRDVITRPTKVEWQGVPGSSLIVSAQYGHYHYDSFIDFNTTGAVGSTDVVSRRVAGESANAGNTQLSSMKQGRGYLTWYKPNSFHGNHEVKAGLDYGVHHKLLGTEEQQVNYHLFFEDGRPYQFVAFNAAVMPSTYANMLSTYVRDSWTLARRLTLNLGVRFDSQQAFFPEQCRDAATPPSDVVFPAECFSRVELNTWNSLAPRLHAAFDVSGDGKTVIKGGWGRYTHLRALEPDVLRVAGNAVANGVFRWHDLNGNLAYDPGEVNLDRNGPDFVETVGRFSQGTGLPSPPPNTVVNQDELQSKYDEFSVSLERELVPNVAVRGTGVYSRTTNVIRLQNNLRPYEAYNIPITNPDPGPDGRVGTGDDPGTSITYFEFSPTLSGRRFEQFMPVNDPNVNQSYTGFEVAVTKRLADRWQLMAAYTATKMNIPAYKELAMGSFVSGSFASAHQAANLTPNDEINRDINTWEWNGKLMGSYLFPLDIQLSGNYEHRSGDIFARQVRFTGGTTIPSIVLNVEPIGSRRTPNLNLVTFRAEKTFPMFNTHRLAVRVNLYNALNASTVTVLEPRAGSDFLRPRAILPPRIAEISASYTF